MQAEKGISEQHIESKRLSPIENHIFHNKPPYRVIVNILLLVLVTVQIQTIFDEDASLPREQVKIQDSSDDETQVLTIQSINDLQSNLQNTQQIFQNINDQLFHNVDLENTTFQIVAYYRTLQSQAVYNVTIDDDITEPFDINNASSIKNFFNSVIQMDFVASNLVTSTFANGVATSCYNWTVTVSYDSGTLSQVDTIVNAVDNVCSQDYVSNVELDPNTQAIFWVSMAIILLAVISLFMSNHYFIKVGKIFIETKASYINYMNHQNTKDMNNLEEKAKELFSDTGNNIKNLETVFSYTSWQDVPWSTKAKIFNYWFIWNSVGNVLQVISSAVVLLTDLSDGKRQSIFIGQVSLGLSVLFTWIQLLQYFEHWKGVVLLHDILHRATTSVYYFFGLVLPAFVGCAIMGYAFFWKYDAFETLGSSAVILFAMSCGDAVHDTFEDIWDEGLQKQIFLLLYMMVFFTAATNIFYALIQDGYDKTRIAMQIREEESHPMIGEKESKPFFSFVLTENTMPAKEFAPEVYALLEEPDVIESERNCINLLLFNLEEVRARITDFMKLRESLEQIPMNDKAKDFLKNMIKSQLNKLLKKVEYYQSMFEK